MTPLELGSGASFDHIAWHARATPDRIAITGPRPPRSWAEFHADAKRFAWALDKLGLRAGQIVVVSHPDSYRHWLLLIACESLGLVSASLAPEDTDIEPLLDLADLVLDEERVAGLIAERDLVAPDHRRYPVRADAPARILRTSGSTGTPKCMIIHRQAQNHRIASIADRNAFGPETRLYIAYPLSVNLNYYRAEACLRRGGTIIFGRASQDLVTYSATHCWLLPRDMVELLQGAGGVWPSSKPLQMSLGGGAVSSALYDQTASLLGTKVTVQYGTNETGFIGVQDRDGIGSVGAGIALRVVDQSGRALPAGEPGRLAVRTPGMARGYLNDPEADAAHFREGWFLTDDVGTLMPDGRFRILGRNSEIINLGGLKVTPGAIEEALRTKVAGIRELAVTSMPNRHGIEELCVAIAPDGAASSSALFEAVQATLPPTLGKFWLLSLEKLPMSPSGKLQRAALREMFRAALRGS